MHLTGRRQSLGQPPLCPRAPTPGKAWEPLRVLLPFPGASIDLQKTSHDYADRNTAYFWNRFSFWNYARPPTVILEVGLETSRDVTRGGTLWKAPKPRPAGEAWLSRGRGARRGLAWPGWGSGRARGPPLTQGETWQCWGLDPGRAGGGALGGPKDAVQLRPGLGSGNSRSVRRF